MPVIKICGLTSLEDVAIVNMLEPDYIGLVFAGSKRRLDLNMAQQLSEALSRTIKRVGIFVDHPREEILSAIAHCQLDVVQLHGNESPKDCMDYPCSVWKAIRVKDAASLSIAAQYQVDGFVLDTYVEGVSGGAGQSFDWELAAAATALGIAPFLLAGGLTPENIAQAIHIARPWGVDVSSGVETMGRKDYEKIKKFIDIVRGYNNG